MIYACKRIASGKIRSGEERRREKSIKIERCVSPFRSLEASVGQERRGEEVHVENRSDESKYY